MSDVTILFGRPHAPQYAEDRFEIEVLAAEELGIDSYAIPLDPIVNGEPERALRRLPRPRSRRWLYRGWMLSEEEYTGLYEAMLERDEDLVVDPESFAEATYVPNYAPLLGEHTAPTRWTEGEDIRDAWEAAEELGPPPWMAGGGASRSLIAGACRRSATRCTRPRRTAPSRAKPSMPPAPASTSASSTSRCSSAVT